MADLLSTLETGITRTGGAERVRSLIGKMDSFMVSQRQAGVFPPPESKKANGHDSQTQAVHHIPMEPMKMNNVMSLSNSNVDPALQNLPAPQNQGQWKGSNMYDYGTGMSGGMNHGIMNGVLPGEWGEVRNNDQFHFQVPPELLQNLPWSFDIGQGFGTFG